MSYNKNEIIFLAYDIMLYILVKYFHNMALYCNLHKVFSSTKTAGWWLMNPYAVWTP